ncbi:MAG TPA: hypothetical protein VNA69_17640 [Thermoanaerobaculia bacterium]|nr:hypothetical protein [Thermoanaerobaculia bacterium]
MRIAIVAVAVLAALPLVAQQYDETITVVRYLLQVRVTDHGGRAITDLTADDFTVQIGGKVAHVESANFVGGAQPTKRWPTLAEIEVGVAPAPAERAGRHIVVLMQTDFGRNESRIKGQLKFNGVADQIVRLLEPSDRVAVLSHDSYLKLRLDFTEDRDAAREAIRRSIRIDKPPPVAVSKGISITHHLNPAAMKNAYSAEEAMLLVAIALHSIEGRRVIILGGWGMGEKRGSNVMLGPEWRQAVDILREDRVPVIVLHTGMQGGQLSLPLMKTAQETGGFFAGTQDFAQQAVNRVEGTLQGHYELSLRVDDGLKAGEHALNIRVNRKSARVLAPASVVNSR